MEVWMLAVKDGGIFIVNIILHSGVIDEGLRANLDMKKHSKRKGDETEARKGSETTQT